MFIEDINSLINEMDWTIQSEKIRDIVERIREELVACNKAIARLPKSCNHCALFYICKVQSGDPFCIMARSQLLEKSRIDPNVLYPNFDKIWDDAK